MYWSPVLCLVIKITHILRQIHFRFHGFSYSILNLILKDGLGMESTSSRFCKFHQFSLRSALWDCLTFNKCPCLWCRPLHFIMAVHSLQVFVNNSGHWVFLSALLPEIRAWNLTFGGIHQLTSVEKYSMLEKIIKPII